jgi:hypothetical protein
MQASSSTLVVGNAWTRLRLWRRCSKCVRVTARAHRVTAQYVLAGGAGQRTHCISCGAGSGVCSRPAGDLSNLATDRHWSWLCSELPAGKKGDTAASVLHPVCLLCCSVAVPALPLCLRHCCLCVDPVCCAATSLRCCRAGSEGPRWTCLPQSRCRPTRRCGRRPHAH